MAGTLLLTGFEPFGAWEVNPSWEVARRLDDESIGGLRVVGRRLPVSWEGTWQALKDYIEEVNPDAILMLGLANKRAYISVESRGLNKCSQTADNEGKQAPGALIHEQGDEAIASTLPVEAIAKSIEALGLPVQVSDDAGGYLCNFAIYKSLAWAREARPDLPIGFIHVPNLVGVAEEGGLSLEEMGSAVTAAVMAIAESLRVSEVSIGTQ
ncbi:MAG: pyroglutamyl-peptidase I [Chloroflexota bacterium]|nr:pyroglutamyl-peptidase I [Chloroflexota bacterium]MDQ5867796.1 pyroglutamyl-peptidase I [Chloroflexota bacterium]